MTPGRIPTAFPEYGKRPATMRRFLALFVLLPIAIVVVVLSVANRAEVTFSLDPFNAVPALSASAPLYVFLFGALALGIVIGGIATWLRQGKWRRFARAERAEVELLRAENAQLRAAAAPPAQLPARHAA
jgi:uncharacterized integral membrane protein